MLGIPDEFKKGLAEKNLMLKHKITYKENRKQEVKKGRKGKSNNNTIRFSFQSLARIRPGIQ